MKSCKVILTFYLQVSKLALPLSQSFKHIKKMKKISQHTLLKMLLQLDGEKPTFISLVSDTDARLKKTNNPYPGVRKRSRIAATLNFNYAQSVQNQRTREGNEEVFIAAERKYGVKIDEKNGCVLLGAGEPKLIVKVDKVLDNPTYLFEGKPIQKHLIEEFIPVKGSATRQETEKEIVYRNYDLPSIVEITMKGETYVIE